MRMPSEATSSIVKRAKTAVAVIQAARSPEPAVSGMNGICPLVIPQPTPLNVARLSTKATTPPRVPKSIVAVSTNKIRKMRPLPGSAVDSSEYAPRP